MALEARYDNATVTSNDSATTKQITNIFIPFSQHKNIDTFLYLVSNTFLVVTWPKYQQRTLTYEGNKIKYKIITNLCFTYNSLVISEWTAVFPISNLMSKYTITLQAPIFVFMAVHRY